MKTHFSWKAAVLGVAIALPIFGAFGQSTASARQRVLRAPQPTRAQASAPRAAAAVRTVAQDNSNVAPANGGSPSDIPAPPAQAPLQPVPMNQSRGFVAQGNCGCGQSYSNGYRSAQFYGNNGGGYRSYSFQGGDPAATLPATEVYGSAVNQPVYGGNAGYYDGGNYGNGGARGNGYYDASGGYHRHNTTYYQNLPTEVTPQNFAGSYGSRASLHHGR